MPSRYKPPSSTPITQPLRAPLQRLTFFAHMYQENWEGRGWSKAGALMQSEQQVHRMHCRAGTPLQALIYGSCD